MKLLKDWKTFLNNSFNKEAKLIHKVISCCLSIAMGVGVGSGVAYYQIKNGFDRLEKLESDIEHQKQKITNILQEKIERREKEINLWRERGNHWFQKYMTHLDDDIKEIQEERDEIEFEMDMLTPQL